MKRKKRLKPPFYILVGIILFLILRPVFNKPIEKTEVRYIDTSVYVDISDKKVSFTAIGDIMCHNTQYMDAYNNGKYDFSYVFKDIENYIKNADISIGNLETTFAGAERGYSSYPTFNTPEALATDIKELGVDVLSTANNHSLDKGYSGLVKTIEKLDEIGIKHTGTYNSEEASQEILYLEKNGIKLAFLSYTYGTNGIPVPKGKEYCINLISDKKIISDLEKAKQKDPDVIVVNMHWGVEYQTSPNKEQERLANLLFKNGVDIILGSHPHVLQQMEKREIQLQDGTKKEGFIIYSLGNFISGQVKENTKESIILNMNIVKNGKTGRISINNINYVPIHMAKNNKYKLENVENSKGSYGIFKIFDRNSKY